jgi:hypothetical protein
MACPGQPFDPSPGLRVSIGDPDAAPGTDAYKGVIVLQGGDPDPIPKAANPIDVKVYFKTALGAAYILPEDMSVTVHVRDLAGDPGGLSPFTGEALVHPDVPAGATVGAAGDIVNWFSSSVTIDAATLADDTTYRITVDADDVDTGVFFFCDLTIIHTEAV